MKRWMSALKWSAVLLAGSFPLLTAGAAPRNPNVRVESWVKISDLGVQVKQVQTFQRQAAADLWNKLDANADGKISQDEKQSADQFLRPMFTDHTTLRFNWKGAQPSTVTVSLGSLPDRLPQKAAKLSFSVTFVADYYPEATSKADAVELSIPDLDAHEGLVHFTWDPVLTPLKASMGKQGKGNIWDMSQTDGNPASFSIVMHRRPSGAESLPNP